MRIAYLAFVLLPFLGYSQEQTSSDSIRVKILEQKVSNIQIDIGRYRNQSMKGHWEVLAGVAISSLALTAKSDSQKTGLIVIGSATMIVGSINILDAYKHLKRASKKR